MDTVFESQPLSLRRALLASIYSLLFVTGTIGNLWVAKVLGTVLVHGRVHSVPRSVQLFILTLCFTDLVVLASMALMIAEMLLGQWSFGLFLCYFYVVIDMVNKFFSPFLLAILSATFYFSVSSNFVRLNRSSFAFACITISLFLALVLASPAFVFADIVEVPLNRTVLVDGVLKQPVMRKCGFRPTADVAQWFMGYGTACGFVVPLLLFCYFYCRLALFIQDHNRSSVRAVPLRAARMIIALVGVYVCCWTPFWVNAWLVFFIHANSTVTTVMLLTHMLPYISCTVYPIIYTAMNRGITEEHERIAALHRYRNWSRSEVSRNSRFSFCSFKSFSNMYSPHSLGGESSSSRIRDSLQLAKSPIKKTSVPSYPTCIVPPSPKHKLSVASNLGLNQIFFSPPASRQLSNASGSFSSARSRLSSSGRSQMSPLPTIGQDTVVVYDTDIDNDVIL